MTDKRLLALTITPEDRERGRSRMIEEAIKAIRKSYDDAIANERAVVQIDVTVRLP